MENAGSWGNLVAQGVIVLFLLFLLALFIRTSMMVSSIVLLAFGRRRNPHESPQVTREPNSDTAEHP